jgi:phosphoserine phosphatase RsbU/P
MVDDMHIYQNKIKSLEKSLYYKDIQVSSLSQITKEINENASADSLYKRFSNFLSTEMAVDRMILLFMEDNEWRIKSSIGMESWKPVDFSAALEHYSQPTFLSKKDKKIFQDLEYIIPIRHKDISIAYVILGHFGLDLRTHDNYEFVATLANIIAVAIENKRLFNRQLEQERFNNEIKLAQEVQQMMVPNEWPQTKHFKVSSIYRPLWNIGGDYIDCFEIDKNRTAFCIADVSGKGIAAAMLMANFQAILHQVIKPSITLDNLVYELNKAVVRITNSEKIITFFIGEFNKKTRTLSYINAGHVPPIMHMNGQLHFLNEGTTLLGAVEYLPTTDVATVEIDSNATLVLYTDGITDLKDQSDRSFEDEILYKFVLRHCTVPVKNFNSMLLDQLEIFNENRDFPDDIAVLTCRIIV